VTDAETAPRPIPTFVPVFNRLLGPLLRSPLHRVISGRLLVLSLSGRKSGKRYTVTISYVAHEGRLLIGTQRPWSKNLAGGTPVEVRLRGKDRTGTADLVTGEAEVAALYQVILAQNAAHGRFMDIKHGHDGRPDPDSLRQALRRGTVVVRITLDDLVASGGR